MNGEGLNRETLPVNNRREPAEWSDLTGLADEALQLRCSPIWPLETSIDVAHSLIRTIRRFDQTAVDTNRYYAIGVVLCEFAKDLSHIDANQEARSDFVQEGARLLMRHYPVKAQLRYNTEGIDVKASGKNHIWENSIKLQLNDAGRVFSDIYDEAIERVPEEVELVGEFLSRCIEPHPEYLTFKGRMKKDRLVALSALGGKTHFARDLKDVLLSGTGAIEDIIDKRHEEDNILSKLPTPEDFELLRDPSTLRFLRGISAGILAQDFDQEELMKHLKISIKDGRRVLEPFNWRKQKEERQKKVQTEVNSTNKTPQNQKRTEPVICPAANITGFFSMMINLSIDMFEIASKKIKEDINSRQKQLSTV